MRILQITVHFSPNVGGVETHLDDLVDALVTQKHQIFILAYRPLSTKTPWKMLEKKRGVSILRIPWLRGFFEKLVKRPALEFLYLLPGLFIFTPMVILFFRPDVLHGHGLVSGFAASFWGKIFRVRSVISIHSIYHFPKKGVYRNFVKLLFYFSDQILCLSQQSVEEIHSLGIPLRKIRKFTYWIDLEKFKKISGAKKTLGWENKFVVLFVGRLIAEKGLNQLMESAKTWNKQSLILADARIKQSLLLRNKQIYLMITGSGPLEHLVKKAAIKMSNVKYLGVTLQDKLPLLYSGADLVILPSTSEEGFGRVIIESLACGTPVIGANRGAIPEAMDSSVGRLIKVSPQNIKLVVVYFYTHPNALELLRTNTRKFAERRYSAKNVSVITKSHSK